jgi:hypothetical protein
MAIDLDFNCELAQVRVNIGDPSGEYITDNAISSALVKYNNDVVKASILCMEALKSEFSTRADREKVGEVEIEYKRLYERYKQLLDDFVKANTSRYSAGIYIGGVSLSERNRVYEDEDVFTGYDQQDWTDIMQSRRGLVEIK